MSPRRIALRTNPTGEGCGSSLPIALYDVSGPGDVGAFRVTSLTGVGRPALQAFAGSLEGQRASKGVFFTTSFFTSDAEDYVRRISRRIVLIDGRALTKLMYDHGIGLRLARTLPVKQVDDAYFDGELT